MKIALLGYGKMGKLIEKIALERGHYIVARIEKPEDLHLMETADVAIDFSIAEAAFGNVKAALELGIPVISGTTGWRDKQALAQQLCLEKKGKLICSSNFSIGVNLFFEVNKKLASLMQHFKQYNASVEETHHIHKLDAPSGTAITIAEDLIANDTNYKFWQLIEQGDSITEKSLPVTAIREDEVPGTHKVRYTSEIDEIEICHTAFSREGFALGAVVCSEWLMLKTIPGVYKVSDIFLNIDKIPVK